MESLMYFLNFFKSQCIIKLARAMEFRFDFIMGIFISFIYSCAGPFFQFLIYTQTNGYPGWNFDQIILFQAILLLWAGLIGTFLGNVRPLITVISQYGLFDRFLLYPYSPIKLVIASGFAYNSLGTLLAGISALVYSVIKLRLSLQFPQILLFFGFLAVGMLFYVSIMILYSAITIRFIFVGRLSQIIDTLVSFGDFPAEIFPKAGKIIYQIIFPVAVWVYYPVQTLLGRINSIALYGVIMAICMFVLSIVIWNRQLKNYTSAGG